MNTKENQQKQTIEELQEESLAAMKKFRTGEDEEIKQKALWSAIETAYTLKNLPTGTQGDYLTTAPFFALQQIVEQFDSSIEELKLQENPQNPLWTIDFSNTHIITGGWDRKIYLCNISDSKNSDCKKSLDAGHIVTSIRFNPGFNMFAAATQNGHVFIESIETKNLSEVKNNNESKESGISSLSFRSNGKEIAVGKWNGQLTRHKVANYDRIDAHVERIKVPIRSISYQPNSTLLAAASENGNVFFENSTRDSQFSIPVSEEILLSINFSPDGEMLVVAGEDGWIRLWEVSKIEALKVSESHDKAEKEWNAKQDWVTGVVFSPHDENIIASAGWNGTVKLWNYFGDQLAEWKVDSPVTDLSFNQNGNKIAVSKLNGSVSYWNIPTLEDLIDRGCSFLDMGILQKADYDQTPGDTELNSFDIQEEAKVCSQKE